MTATTLSKVDRKLARVPDDIQKLSADLHVARNVEHSFDRARRIGIQLAPLLETAYWNHPEVFASGEVREARRFVAWLKRARYIEPKRSKTYRAGSPGLGRRA